MNRGTLRGFAHSARNSKPWAYHALKMYWTVIDGSTDAVGYLSASKAFAYTPSMAGVAGVPNDGSVRAFRVLLIMRVNTAGLYWKLLANDYEEPGPLWGYQNRIGQVDADANERGVGVWNDGPGYVSNQGIVLTGGIGNTQFKWAAIEIDDGGIANCYIRVLGYYVDAEWP